MPLRVAPLLAFLLLLAPGCSLTSSDAGTFSMTVRGAFSRDLAGTTRYDPLPDGATVALLPEGVNQGSQVLVELTPGALRPGTVTLTPAVGSAAVVYQFPAIVEGEVEAVLFRATAGTLTLTTASADRIEGTFDVTATEQDPEQPGVTTPEGAREVTLRGSFEAPSL